MAYSERLNGLELILSEESKLLFSCRTSATTLGYVRVRPRIVNQYHGFRRAVRETRNPFEDPEDDDEYDRTVFFENVSYSALCMVVGIIHIERMRKGVYAAFTSTHEELERLTFHTLYQMAIFIEKHIQSIFTPIGIPGNVMRGSITTEAFFTQSFRHLPLLQYKPNISPAVEPFWAYTAWMFGGIQPIQIFIRTKFPDITIHITTPRYPNEAFALRFVSPPSVDPKVKIHRSRLHHPKSGNRTHLTILGTFSVSLGGTNLATTPMPNNIIWNFLGLKLRFVELILELLHEHYLAVLRNAGRAGWSECAPAWVAAFHREGMKELAAVLLREPMATSANPVLHLEKVCLRWQEGKALCVGCNHLRRLRDGVEAHLWHMIANQAIRDLWEMNPSFVHAKEGSGPGRKLDFKKIENFVVGSWDLDLPAEKNRGREMGRRAKLLV